mmetsp:Transcript_26516/g.84059  ORF Transcript_26516/g.84059 Transcript_26516/m.84059 type:complete len:242 (+) Transcript_26516:297-1022(+)
MAPAAFLQQVHAGDVPQVWGGVGPCRVLPRQGEPCHRPASAADARRGCGVHGAPGEVGERRLCVRAPAPAASSRREQAARTHNSLPNLPCARAPLPLPVCVSPVRAVPADPAVCQLLFRQPAFVLLFGWRRPEFGEWRGLRLRFLTASPPLGTPRTLRCATSLLLLGALVVPGEEVAPRWNRFASICVYVPPFTSLRFFDRLSQWPAHFFAPNHEGPWSLECGSHAPRWEQRRCTWPPLLH